MGTVHRAVQLVGSSQIMRDTRASLQRLAEVPWPARIEGPTGSGKGVAARLLHDWSPRSRGPFVKYYANVHTEGLELDELFGHTKGAFTGATGDRIGCFEAAHGGTLFIDEIATASPRAQLALLQHVEEKTVRRSGELRDRRLDFRLVTASNVDLEDAVLAGLFRQDLFFRLGELLLPLPALHEHREDIPELVDVTLEHKASEMKRNVRPLSEEELAQLTAYEWPGNVRELINVIESFCTFGRLPPKVTRTENWRESVDAVLRKNGGNKTRAARELGISRKTLHEELRSRQAQDR